jgi:hypothetical protein
MDDFMERLFGTRENLQKVASLGESAADAASPEEEALLKAASDRVDQWNQQLASETGQQVDYDTLTDDQKQELIQAALEELQAEGAGQVEQQGQAQEVQDGASEEQVVEAFNKLAFAEIFGRTYGDLMFEAEMQKAAAVNADPLVSELVELSQADGAVGRAASILAKEAAAKKSALPMKRGKGTVAALKGKVKAC